MWPHNPWATNHSAIPPISLYSKQECSSCCIVKSCVGAFISEADVKLESPRQQRTYSPIIEQFSTRRVLSLPLLAEPGYLQKMWEKKNIKKKNKQQQKSVVENIAREFPSFEPWLACLGRGEMQQWEFQKIEWANAAMGFMDPCNRTLYQFH